MKINTDGVLLGALAETDNPETILDIGTGTGVIALMLAQRFPDAQIDAVEIDEPAAETAKQNFANSPFADRLTLHALGFEDYLKQCNNKYDLIVSNPPFYINSLESPGEKKSLAKHADANFFEKLVKISAAQLSKNGKLYFILPLQTAQLVKVIAVDFGLNLKQAINVLSYPDSEPHREILMFSMDGTKELDDWFIIYQEPKIYSQQYQTLLSPFFTIF